MKYDACLARLIEVQVVPDDYIEKIVRSKCAIRGRLDVVAGNKKLLLPIWGREYPGVRIVCSVGKKLQSQKWMSGPAFSQVNLDGIRLPFSMFPRHDHKIQSETTYDPFVRQTPAYLGSLPGDQRGVTCIGRENTAEIPLPGWATEKLVMRR